MAYIKGLILTTVLVCGRRYVFLVYSTSQQREHNCWFLDANAVAERGGSGGGVTSSERLTPADVLAWMGQWEHIRTPATLAKRLGQCLSTTYR
eukprot:578730-Prorocentrum_minimum.AAC.2